jgi:hypothetical protein
MRRITWWISSLTILTLTLALAACNRSPKNDEASAATDETQGSSPAERVIAVPAATPLVISLDTALSTETNQTGDSFTGKLTQPVVVEGSTVLPAGTMVTGTIAAVTPPSQGKASLSLTLTRVMVPAGGTYKVNSNTMQLVAKASTEKDLEKVAAGGVAGGILGGIVGGGKGALIGAAVGTGAGTAVAVATRDNHVHLASGQQLQFELTEAMRLPPVA